MTWLCSVLPARRIAMSPCVARPGSLMSGPDSPRPTGPPRPGCRAAARSGRVTIEVEAAPGATTIVVRGELDLVTMPFLAEQLTLVSRDRPGRLVFDLAGTRFMDCGSARLIAAAGHGCLRAGGRSSAVRAPASAGSSSSPVSTLTAK